MSGDRSRLRPRPQEEQELPQPRALPWSCSSPCLLSDAAQAPEELLAGSGAACDWRGPPPRNRRSLSMAASTSARAGARRRRPNRSSPWPRIQLPHRQLPVAQVRPESDGIQTGGTSPLPPRTRQRRTRPRPSPASCLQRLLTSQGPVFPVQFSEFEEKAWPLASSKRYAPCFVQIHRAISAGQLAQLEPGGSGFESQAPHYFCQGSFSFAHTHTHMDSLADATPGTLHYVASGPCIFFPVHCDVTIF